jgi:hypothetical protein
MKDIDIVLIDDNSFFSRVVNFFIGKWSHCFIMYNQYGPVIIHADGGKVRMETLDGLLKGVGDYKFKAFRLRKDYVFDKARAIEYLNEQRGKKYNIMNAIGRGLYRLAYYLFRLKRDSTSIFYDTNHFICSVLVGGLFKDQGIDIKQDVDWTQLEPGDIEDSLIFEEVTEEWNSQMTT